jgi:hypothetical protein
MEERWGACCPCAPLKNKEIVMENMNDTNSQKGKSIGNEPDTHKIVISILLAAEILITLSTIVTFGLYNYFYKINGYVFTWFWIKGLFGIVLFIIGAFKEKIVFKKSFIGYLIIPVIFSVLSFIGIIRGIMRPWNYNYYIEESIQELCYVIGFPLWILYLLQDRHKANRYLIGMSGCLTPLARFIVSLIMFG